MSGVSRLVRTSAPLRAVAVLSFVACASTAPRAQADPVIGFVDHFPAGSTGRFASQDSVTNPGTGGKDGAGDGFVRISEHTNFHLGAFSDSTAYAGDWIAANVDRVRFWLSDVDAQDNLEIHFGIGNGSNFWQANAGFIPPLHTWAQFTVNVADSTQFTHTIAFVPGFAAALHAVDRVQVRHDRAPFVQSPDLVSGDFGLDDFETTSSLVGVGAPPPAAPRAVALAAPYPNPSRGRMACAFEVFDAAPVRVAVVDAAGRLVRAETLAGGAPGPRTWTWDGRDDRGAAAPAGSYRVRVVGAAGGMSRPFVLLR